MKRILVLLAALILLTACGAQTDMPQANPELSDNQVTPAEQEQIPTTDTETTESVIPDQPAPDTKSTPEKAAETGQPGEVFPLATFIELGAESCIPCKMMQPILKEVREEYQGLVKVIFIDLYKDRAASQKYSVRVMPTQVFLDRDGREFFRHEGFYPKEEIEKMLNDYLPKPNRQ